MNNREVANTFEAIADMLAIRGDHIHRVLAYRRAAENIRELNRDLNLIRDEGQLTEIPGIGSTLAEKIEEMLTTGQLEFYERLAQEIPPSLTDLLLIEGVGPKRVKQIYEALGITTIDELMEAAQSGKLRSLPGLGAKSEERIIESIQNLTRFGSERTPLGVAWPIARDIVNQLKQLPGVEKVTFAGSLRRMKETIGDIDLLVAANEAEPIMTYFREMEAVETILGSGPTKSSVLLVNGLQVDLRVLPPARWGTLLAYFTGSKDHNVRLRELALKRGLSLNEYAFSPVDGSPPILCRTEEEVYENLGLPYIRPEMRENNGEIEAALSHSLPLLIERTDLLSDLHVHSTWSDGKMSIMDMAQAAMDRGMTHLVIADHSVSLGIANGLSIERLRDQAAEIQSLNERLGPNFRVLHGIEMEIRADGSLDYSDEIIAELDFVIASLHVGLRQSQEQIMERLKSAMENPHVDMIAHPTGRLIPDRPGADIDMEAFLKLATDTGTIVEINANPQRLDLQDRYVRRANELNVRLAINTDAHHADQLDFTHFGVATAQRGWTIADNVVNAWSLDRLLTFLQRYD